MGFKLVVVSNRPIVEITNPDEVAYEFLRDIGYLQKEKTFAEGRKSPAFRLFVDCFLRHPEKAWTVEELESHLGFSRPTLYRHLNKLKELDILEAVPVELGEENGAMKKGYRLKYGDLKKAWSFVEAHVDMAMENYRKTVNHLWALFEKERLTGEKKENAEDDAV